jgi:hypothetical protein
MLLCGHSQSSIVLSAKTNFSTDFQQVPGPKDVTIQLHKTSSPEGQGYLKGLAIGTGTDEEGKTIDVLAWLEDDSLIIGYVTISASRVQDIRYDSAKSVLQSVNEFKEPFCWVLGSGQESAFAQLKALLRYYFLVKGSVETVKDHIQVFEKHFENACRVIAAARGVEWTDLNSTGRMCTQQLSSCKLQVPITIIISD